MNEPMKARSELFEIFEPHMNDQMLGRTTADGSHDLDHLHDQLDEWFKRYVLEDRAKYEEALKPITDYVYFEKQYTTMLSDHHANDIRLVMRDLRMAEERVHMAEQVAEANLYDSQ